MDSNALLDWHTTASVLKRVRRRKAIAVLLGRNQDTALKAAIELGVDYARRCPQCAAEGAVSRSKAQGLGRYRCKGCKGCGRPKVGATGGPTAVLEPVVAKVALQVSAGGTRRPPCVAALRVSHETLNRSVGERVRGNLTEQSMNCRHIRVKDFLHTRRGIATRYLGHCPRSFNLAGIAPGISDQANLAAPVTN